MQKAKWLIKFEWNEIFKLQNISKRNFTILSKMLIVKLLNSILKYLCFLLV